MTLTSDNLERLSLLSSMETDAATEGVVAARSLILMRWCILVGQFIALLGGYFLFALDLPLGGALAVASAGLVLNIGAMLHYRLRSRLATHEAALYFAFDILQLTLLVYLTGGLDNPFAVFLITPVAMAASLLRFWAVFSLTALTLLSLLFNALWHLPLPWPHGQLSLPPLFGWMVFAALSIAVLFIALYSWSVARDNRRVRYALSLAQTELAGANQMTAMGALAAAVAHELGTPLGTINLVAKELQKEIEPDDPIRDDVDLLVSQAERCRQVLADFARRPSAEGGDPYRLMLLTGLIEEAAAPHRSEKINFMVLEQEPQGAAPLVHRRPELLHGLGNFLQNAFQYAKGVVVVRLSWQEDKVSITIDDDGPGYAPAVLQKMGEPYVSTRAASGSHMGLGTFIARTLIARTGGKVSFSNKLEGGARVAVTWPRSAPIFRS